MVPENIASIKEVKDISYYSARARFMFIVLLIPVLGLIAVNQILEFHYKTEFLKTPCSLCAELNPGVQQCITEINTHASYWTVNGWTDPTNKSTTEINLSYLDN